MTKTFDGTEISIDGNEVSVTEGGKTLELVKRPGDCLVANAIRNTDGMLRAGSVTAWEADRFVFCFGLAQRWMA